MQMVDTERTKIATNFIFCEKMKFYGSKKATKSLEVDLGPLVVTYASLSERSYVRVSLTQRKNEKPIERTLISLLTL